MKSFRPYYLDHRTGWEPMDVPPAPTEDEARVAARRWLGDHARTRKGYRPPVSIREEKPERTDAP